MSFCEKGFSPCKEKNDCRKEKHDCHKEKECKQKCWCFCCCIPQCKPHKEEKKCCEVKRHRPDCEKEKKFPCCCEKEFLPYWWENDCKSPCEKDRYPEWENEKRPPCGCGREYEEEREYDRKPERNGYSYANEVEDYSNFFSY